MKGHTPSSSSHHTTIIGSSSYEETMALFHEKAPSSDLGSDAGSSSRDESETFSSSSTLTTRNSSPARSEILGGISSQPFSSQLPISMPSLPSIPWPSSSHCRRRLFPLLTKIGIFLLPSFLQPKGHHHTTLRLSPTAYLDGIRGLAALFVFFCHYFYTCYVIATGYGLDEGNYHLLKLPFIRLLYSGPPMVCVFFVVSGYALSLKPLKQIRARQFAELSNTMSSFIFRRGLRLFLPAAISTFFICLLVRSGWYAANADFATSDLYLRNVQETHYEGHPEDWGLQIQEWACDLFQFVHVWDWTAFGGSTSMDVHLWTIPVEFRASMALFLSLMGMARLKTARKRFAVLGFLVLFCYYSARWEMVLFYAGMGLAEMDLIRGAHTPSQRTEKEEVLPLKSARPKRWNGKVKKWWWLGMSVLGLYLMSQPDQGSDMTPGWFFLTDLIPLWWNYDDLYRYWQSVGAVIFVMAVGRSKGWQRFFESPVVQYFGKISYALYLMHGPVLHTAGYSIERFVWQRVTGVESDMAYHVGFGLAAVFVVPITIWVADVFWRGVDAPVVRFAKWFEGVWTIEE
ncbi:acyltransferase [Podospora australis]|uniref:Acyltransferase n=1 Tax=Podospora australis TaxID=1536484 RepID=A0AAN7AL19_9PEZI|nr:acyltransferase [Podospora australis]